MCYTVNKYDNSEPKLDDKITYRSYGKAESTMLAAETQLLAQQVKNRTLLSGFK